MKDTKITRQEILEMNPGKKLDTLVHKYVMGNEIKELYKSPNYSTDILDMNLIVEAYRKSFYTFLVNIIDTFNGFGVGWHCNFNSVHVQGCKTMQEAVAKASLIYALGLSNESEEYQRQKRMLSIERDLDKLNNLEDKIQGLEKERLYTKSEIRQIFGFTNNLTTNE